MPFSRGNTVSSIKTKKERKNNKQKNKTNKTSKEGLGPSEVAPHLTLKPSNIYIYMPLDRSSAYMFGCSAQKQHFCFFWGGDMRNYPGLCDRVRPSSSLLRSVSVTNVYLSLSPNPPKALNPKLDPNPEPQHKFKP